MRDVLMPTSAPSPNRKPSAKRVVALWKTQALSTRFKKSSALDLLPVQDWGRNQNGHWHRAGSGMLQESEPLLNIQPGTKLAMYKSKMSRSSRIKDATLSCSIF